jgi:GNAT superfamily N-acetyltransferase
MSASPQPGMRPVAASETPYRIQNKDYYFVNDGEGEVIAHVEVGERHGVIILTNVWVHHEHRRKGLATQLVERVIADYGDRDLYLHVRAYIDQPLDDEALIVWYTRFGFEPIADAPGMMRRRGDDAA